MRTAAIALAITLAIQVFTSLAATATSVLAPEIGRDLGIAPKLIGVFVGLVYAGSMVASLASGGFIERYGAIRVSQACVLLCACGVGLRRRRRRVAATSSCSTLIAAAIVIGLGYGPITPASSQVLARTAPALAHGADVFDQADRACRPVPRSPGHCCPSSRWRSPGNSRSRWSRRRASASRSSRRVTRATLDAERKSRPIADRRRSSRAAPPRARHTGPAGAGDRHVLRLRRAAGLPDELPGRLPDRDARALARRGRLRADRGESRRDRRPDRLGRGRRSRTLHHGFCSVSSASPPASAGGRPRPFAPAGRWRRCSPSAWSSARPRSAGTACSSPRLPATPPPARQARSPARRLRQVRRRRRRAPRLRADLGADRRLPCRLRGLRRLSVACGFASGAPSRVTACIQSTGHDRRPAPAGVAVPHRTVRIWLRR